MFRRLQHRRPDLKRIATSVELRRLRSVKELNILQGRAECHDARQFLDANTVDGQPAQAQEPNVPRIVLKEYSAANRASRAVGKDKRLDVWRAVEETFDILDLNRGARILTWKRPD